MKTLTTFLAAAACLALTGAAQANEKLAQASGCTACHSVDKKLIGPSYKDVAAKYRGKKDAEAELFKKVRPAAKASGAKSRCRPTRTSRTTTSSPW